MSRDLSLISQLAEGKPNERVYFDMSWFTTDPVSHTTCLCHATSPIREALA